MNLLRNLKIGTRLALAFACILALTLTVGVISEINLRAIVGTASEVEKDWLPSVKAASSMKANVTEYRASELQHILSSQGVDLRKYENDMDALAGDVAASVQEFDALVSGDSERTLLSRFRSQWSSYLHEHEQIIDMARANKDAEALAMIRGESLGIYTQLSETLTQLVALNVEGAGDATLRAEHVASTSQGQVLATLLGALATGIGLSYLISRSILRQLGGEPQYAAAVVNQIAQGNLAVAVRMRDGDKHSLLASMDQMRHRLQDVVIAVRGNAIGVAHASGEIAQGTRDLSERTEEQASALEQTAATMHQLGEAADRTADSAHLANELAMAASAVATQGGQVVDQVVGTMQSITDSSTKIVDIVAMIDALAFQTNMLALNAAVESARAGEHGKGFAVVASEVRALAQRSAAAAKEVKGLIFSSVQSVERGGLLVEAAGATMRQVVESAQKVTHLTGEIKISSAAQSAGISQVDSAVNQLDEVTQQNAALVEQSAAAAQELNAQAAQLVSTVAVFNVGSASSVAIS